MKRAVIFDLDGTLWETLDCNYECMNEVAKKYNLDPIDKETICKMLSDLCQTLSLFCKPLFF